MTLASIAKTLAPTRKKSTMEDKEMQDNINKKEVKRIL